MSIKSDHAGEHGQDEPMIAQTAAQESEDKSSSNASRTSEPPEQRDYLSRSISTLRRRAHPIHGLINAFCMTLLFDVPYILFVYHVLVKGKVKVGATIFDASKTNLLVSIFSQTSAILADMTLRELLGVLRLKLARRDRGVSASTWFSIGLSSQWMSTALLLVAWRLPNLWCLFRLQLPLLNIGLGALVKFQANFDYYFVPGNVQIPVYAGLIDLENRVLQAIKIPDLCQYFTTWTSSMQSNSRYATSTVLDDCKGDCGALLWPGGMETIRQVSAALNRTIFHEGYFVDVDAVRIDHAPGFITTFRGLNSNFTFDFDQDCHYGGPAINDSLKICIRQVGQGIAAGWAACPDNLFLAGSCDTNATWKEAPLKWKTMMNAYRQFTSTTYDRRNLSIINASPIGEPQPHFINATTYLEIIQKILIPDSSSNSMANASIAALTYDLTWVYRTYSESFPDDTGTLSTVLENFLTIPLQWTITAFQYANYTVPTSQLAFIGNFSLPEDMLTTATGGSSTQRLAIQSWTGWTSIAAQAVVLLVVFANIIVILREQEPLIRTTGMADIDTFTLAQTAECLRVPEKLSVHSQSGNDPVRHDSPISLGRLAQETRNLSSFTLARKLHHWRLKISKASNLSPMEMV